MHDGSAFLTASAATRTRPLLDARGLSFCAGGRALINGVDLVLPEGSRTVILGPNGAGKSLLLRLLHGLIQPNEGTLLWDGEPVGRQSRAAQALVFQRPVLLRRTVLANLVFALKAAGVARSKRTDMARAALERARLAQHARSPARLLSGGEQQRLALAMAMARRPRLLFLDEPTASLDPASTQAFECLLLEAHAEGVTIVMVTHDAGQARRVGDRLVFLQDGQIAETGQVDSCLAAPRSAPLKAWRDGQLYLPQAKSA